MTDRVTILRRPWAIAGYGATAALAVYSALLLVLEWRTSQDVARLYMTDIEGPVRFYAINTTLSVFLLGATGLLFLVCSLCHEDREPRAVWFYLSQWAVFGYLAFDDRFKVHESIGWRLEIGDHFVLLSVVALEVALVFRYREILRPIPWAREFLLGGTVLTGVMFIFDALVPHDMVLRLSIEDLAKSWAAFLFLCFAWACLRHHLGELKAGAQRATES
ncbi:MAG: hypothetical protein AAF628_06135 [Planctomycetota bacterium]